MSMHLVVPFLLINVVTRERKKKVMIKYSDFKRLNIRYDEALKSI